MKSTPPMDIAVAIAILTQGEQVLMQLRDDIPNIIYPGCWGFFGGHLEPDETPVQALIRELTEEISYTVPQADLFGVYGDRRDDGSKVTRHVFTAPLDVPLDQLQLNEGWDMALITKSEAVTGKVYSAIAQQWRPIPPIHQRILVDFFTNQNK